MDGAIFTVAERSDRALPLLLSGGPGANANVYRRYSTNGPTFGLVQNLGHGDSTVAHTGLLLTPGVYFVPDGQMVTGIWASRDRQGLQWQPAMTLETYDVMPGYKGLRGRFTVAPRPDGSLPVATLGTGNLALEPVIWKQNGPAASFYCGAFNTLSPGVVMEAGTYTVMFGEFPTSSINAVLAEMKYVLPLVGYWAKPS